MSNTFLMKVAISVPDPVFRAAEHVSRRMRVSRSKLYAQAVTEYVRRHSDNDVTTQLNEVYAKVSSKLDPAIEKSSLATLRGEKWG